MLRIENKLNGSYEYYYNDYIDMYCVVGTTISMQYFDELIDLFAFPGLLVEIEIPDYITSEYNGLLW